ncbi:MAG: hypothetical protein EA361_07145 [Bacteroidetes bacterium]|nr:MAG: hypothetical protein EA361_07145 [Bacteroidota bacterium]
MNVKDTPNKKANLNVLDQVLRTLFTVDKKIHELHKCSSDDFLSLNRTLKHNHERASYITKNVTLAFEKIGPEGNLNSLGVLKNSLVEFQQELHSFDGELSINLEVLERIQSNFSLMFVPINNFRQNLTSLKLLLSNIKLTNNLYDRSLKNFSDIESARIEGVINKVKESCPIFEENIFVIQNHLKTLYQDLAGIKDFIFNDLLKKLDALSNEIVVIEKHNQEAANLKAKTDVISKNCNSSVGSIITNLQYHDIIRQKMEHIQQTHKLIIAELNNNEKAQERTTDTVPNPFFLQIPQIIEIQTAQLLHTNKEYQNAIDHISKKMTEIGQDMAALARIFKSISVFEYQGSHVSRERISEAFSKLISDKREYIGRFNTLSEDISLIQRIVNNLFEKFQDLELIENSIEQTIIDKISFGNLLVSEEGETASQAQQILKLYADNHFEKNKIRTLFKDTNAQLKDFGKNNNLYVYNKKGMERINHNLDTAEKSFAEVISNLDFLEELQPEILDRSQQIVSAGKEVVANVKYYDFFEKTIDELIGKFDSVSALLIGQGNGYTDSLEQKKGLEQIQKYYTMKSERIIHNHSILNTGKAEGFAAIIETPEESDNSRQGNDVEFF